MHDWSPGLRVRRALHCGAASLLLTGCRSVASSTPTPYPHGTETIGTVRQSYDGALSPALAIATFRNIDRLFPTRAIAPSTSPRPLPAAAHPLGPVEFTDRGTRYSLDDYVRLNRVTGMLVLSDGRVALERYEHGNSPATRWMSMSVAKSITSTLIGAAVRDGRIASLDDSVTRYVPALAGSAYAGASIRDVLMMSSGVKWIETYTDPTSDRRQLLEAQIAQRPGAALALMAKLPRAAAPGTRNNYSTGETQVAGEIVRGAVGKPLAVYLSERIWQKAGMESEARWWLDSPNGTEIGGSGISATLRDYARFGQFMLEEGIVRGERILPDGWVRDAGSPTTLRDGTPLAYGYMWWTASTLASQHDRAFSAQGIHGQFVYINPAQRVVIVVWSAQPKPTGGAVIDDEVVFDAVVRALRAR
jgi:CubicO group peptidase (beta-lactamase class C family)